MDILSKLFYKAGEFFNFKKKWVDYPTISGGFDIFRNFSWEGGISKSKALATYSKSLYVFACVSKIAQKTASIDWNLFRIKNKVGDKQEIYVSPALDLLYRPNPFQTKGEFFEKYMINKKLAGEAFVLKVRRNGPGSEVIELWNLRPDYMTIIKDKETFIKGYEFTHSGTTTTFAPEDIIHDAYPNPLDDYGGISPLASAEVRVETEMQAVRYQKNFFANNARPDFILSTDMKVDNEQKEEIKASWEKRHKGSGNSGKGAFLEGGLKYQQVSISQREMDYIESLKMTRDDILTAFGVPKPIVAVTDDVNLANAKTAMEIFLSETIVPEIKRLTEKLNENLIYPEYGDVYYIDFENPITDNEKETAEVQQIQITSGVLLINEAREKLGLPPVQGGWSLYMPLSNVPVGGLSQSGKGAKDFDEAEILSKTMEIFEQTQKEKQGKVFRGRSAAYKFLEVREQVEKDVYDGIVKNLKNKTTLKTKSKALIPKEIRATYYDTVNKSIDKKGDAFKPAVLKYGEDQEKRIMSALRSKSIDKKAVDGLFDFAKENKLLTEISIPFISEFITSAGEQSIQMINPAEQFVVTDKIQKYIKERAKQMAKEVNATTVEKLSRVLAEGIDAGEGIGKLTERVAGVYSEYPTYRAETIARTEATSANNKGFMESYEQSGVANAKEWIATNDGRTRDSHADADGEIIGLDASFSNGLEYPGDPGADPAETINCRCVLAPAFKE